MIASNFGKFNNYITDYDKLRDFLRYISYGCYHKQYLAKKLGYSDRKYDNIWSQVRSFLPNDRLLDRTLHRRKYHGLRGDSYYSSHNYLAKSYHMKALTPMSTFIDIAVMQALASADKPQSVKEICDIITENINSDDNSSKAYLTASQMYKYLQNMTQRGITTMTKVNRTYVYSLSPNPLTAMTRAELNILRNAICFYRNTAPFSFPFYYLEETIRLTGKLEAKKRSYSQFKHTRLVTILDELTAMFILYCIENNLALSFKYNKKNVTAIPVKLVNNYYTRHQYLVAFDTSKRPIHQKFRLDKITNIKSCQTDKHPMPIQEKISKVVLKLHTKTPDELQDIIKKIHSIHPEAEISSDEFCYVTIYTEDTLQLFPWIRTLHPYAEIIEPSGLRKRMIQDLQEVLANYE